MPRARSSKPLACRLTLAGLFVCLGWTLATGLLLGVKAARPTLGVESLPMQVLQPLHVLGVMSFLVGSIGVSQAIILVRLGGRPTISARTCALATLAFLASAASGILVGQGSGLEYLPWPLALSAAPASLLALLAFDAWANLGVLARRAAEGAWLLLAGVSLVPLGLAERILGSDASNVTRTLMLEWHSIDTVFAGFNTALYGLGILFAAPEAGEPRMRGRWLYLLAAFALLSTFGHHHYASGQPDVLKLIAFGASMLGLVSFIRHVRGAIRARRTRRDPEPADPGHPLIAAAALWTLFAVGTGVLLAVPQVNLLLHGTHAIVGHSMGATIGVNVMLVLGLLAGDAGAGFSPGSAGALRRQTRAASAVLALLVLDLVVAGFAKGVVRLAASHHAYQPLVRSALIPLPVLGLALAGLLASIGLRIVGANRRARLVRSPALVPHDLDACVVARDRRQAVVR